MRVLRSKHCAGQLTQVCVNGKSTIIEKDRTKTKSSYRMLPLVPPFEELLYRLQAQQEMNRKLCGRMYHKEFSGYIYVNEIGELVKPGYITQHFPLVLQKNGKCHSSALTYQLNSTLDGIYFPVWTVGALFGFKKGTDLNERNSRTSFTPAEVSARFAFKKGTG